MVFARSREDIRAGLVTGVEALEGIFRESRLLLTPLRERMGAHRLKLIFC